MDRQAKDRIVHDVSVTNAPQRGLATVAQPPLKIAILLPTHPDWRMIRRAGELGAALIEARSLDPRPVEITFGLPEAWEKRWLMGEKLLRQRLPGVIVRHVEWTRIPVANAKRMFFDFPPNLDLEGITEISVPRDWGWNFQDCDCWISFADPGQGAILPLRPTTFFCTGLPERYIADAVAGSIHDDYWTRQVDAFRIWRQSLVITSDPDTLTDIAGYAGVRRNRIELAPDLLGDVIEAAPEQPSRMFDRIVWRLTGTQLDDLSNALQGLATYYREGGSLEVVLAAENYDVVAAHPARAGLPGDLRDLYDQLEKATCRGLAEFERLIGGAGIYWASETAGGVSDHLHEAGRAGLTLLAPDYGLNRQGVERLGLCATLYERDDPLAICDALHALEQGDEGDRTDVAARGDAPSAEQRAQAFGFLIDRMAEALHVG